MKTITVTLDPDVNGIGPEEASIAGWVNYYKANPQYIGKTPTAGSSPPDGQTKIVLDNRSRARHDEIAAQFGAVPPVSVNVVPTSPASLNNDSVPLPWFKSANGQVNATISTGAGRASAVSSSGGDLTWISTDPTFPPIEGVTKSAQGNSGEIVVAAGQTFYFKQTTALSGYQDMRASVAA